MDLGVARGNGVSSVSLDGVATVITAEGIGRRFGSAEFRLGNWKSDGTAAVPYPQRV